MGGETSNTTEKRSTQSKEEQRSEERNEEEHNVPVPGGALVRREGYILDAAPRVLHHRDTHERSALEAEKRSHGIGARHFA